MRSHRVAAAEEEEQLLLIFCLPPIQRSFIPYRSRVPLLVQLPFLDTRALIVRVNNKKNDNGDDEESQQTSAASSSHAVDSYSTSFAAAPTASSLSSFDETVHLLVHLMHIVNHKINSLELHRFSRASTLADREFISLPASSALLSVEPREDRAETQLIIYLTHSIPRRMPTEMTQRQRRNKQIRSINDTGTATPP